MRVGQGNLLPTLPGDFIAGGRALRLRATLLGGFAGESAQQRRPHGGTAGPGERQDRGRAHRTTDGDANPRAKAPYERLGFVKVATQHLLTPRRLFGFGSADEMRKDFG